MAKNIWEREKYGKRKGLEGPFTYPNGRTLYYDPKEGMYWDPSTDWYLDALEIEELKMSLLKLVAA